MRNQKGITLIALVITIIVLLILAGVSIAMLTGENGILTRAEDSKISTVEGQVRDAVAIAVSDYRIQVYNQTNPSITAANIMPNVQETMGDKYTVAAVSGEAQQFTVKSATGQTTDLGTKTITVTIDTDGSITTLTTTE